MPYHRMVGDYGSQRGGFGSILSGILGGVANVATGNIGGAVRSVVGGFKPSPSVSRPTGRPMPATIVPPRFTGVSLGGPSGIRVGRETTSGQYLVATGTNLPATSYAGGGGPAGHHLNKTGYFLKSGEYVAPGTRWVRNRTRNPANGKALRRAVGRVQSFNNVVKRSRKSLKRLASI